MHQKDAALCLTLWLSQPADFPETKTSVREAFFANQWDNNSTQQIVKVDQLSMQANTYPQVSA